MRENKIDNKTEINQNQETIKPEIGITNKHQKCRNQKSIHNKSFVR